MKGFKKFNSGGKVSGHAFPSNFGFTGSAGKSSVSSHMRAKSKPMMKADGGAVQSGSMPPKLPAQNAPTGKVNFQDFKKGGKTGGGGRSGC